MEDEKRRRIRESLNMLKKNMADAAKDKNTDDEGIRLAVANFIVLFMQQLTTIRAEKDGARFVFTAFGVGYGEPELTMETTLNDSGKMGLLVNGDNTTDYRASTDEAIKSDQEKLEIGEDVMMLAYHLIKWMSLGFEFRIKHEDIETSSAK